MATPTNRKDDDEDSKRTYYRMSRFFTVNGEWFFCYREGEQVGPYETKTEAEEGAKLYSDFMRHSDNAGEGVQIAKNGKWKITQYY